MLQAAWEQVQAFLGLERDIGDVNTLQMTLRAIVIYSFTLALVRFGSKRFLSEATAFDVIVSIMLGSIMSRAINSSAPLVPTLFAGLVLVGLHMLFAYTAVHVDWFGPIVKGNPILLIKDGVVQKEGQRQAGLSDHDLLQALRLKASQTEPEGIRLAYMERNGRISMIPSDDANNYTNDDAPRVIDVAVADGVQTVRIKLD
jgi:uncharacterized membrane protein YcaP (DUF421 family)